MNITKIGSTVSGISKLQVAYLSLVSGFPFFSESPVNPALVTFTPGNGWRVLDVIEELSTLTITPDDSPQGLIYQVSISCRVRGDEFGNQNELRAASFRPMIAQVNCNNKVKRLIGNTEDGLYARWDMKNEALGSEVGQNLILEGRFTEPPLYLL